MLSVNQKLKKKRRQDQSGNALILTTIFIVLGLILTVGFLKRSHLYLSMTSVVTDQKGAEYQMETGQQLSLAKIKRVVSGITLTGRLPYVSGGPTSENYDDLSDRYATNESTATDFLKHLIVMQSYSPLGVHNTAHEFADFETAFPSDWTDPDPSDGLFYQVKYHFAPIGSIFKTYDKSEMIFEYEFQIDVRAYGLVKYSQVQSQNAGTLQVKVRGSPFSSYALFRATNTNQNGWLLVFAGGTAAGTIQEIFGGPVHMNETPYFYGSPKFNGKFTSTTAASSWWQGSDSSYSGSANFSSEYGSEGGVSSISMPSNLFNNARLAAGDQANNAATDDSQLDETELVGLLRISDSGTLALGTTTLPNGTYIPVDSAATKSMTGGVYVRGDVKIQMDVIQGSSQWDPTYYGNIAASDRSCKYQKIRIQSLEVGVPTKDIFVGADPCIKTYVFNADDTGSSPVALSGRLNGNIYIEGKIDEIGEVSRSRPAVVQDFGWNIVATKEIRILNDLQYEDATYVAVNSDLSLGSTQVASPTGTYSSSGYTNTGSNVAPQLSEDSQTVLGLVSLYKNVLVHENAPANLNIHAAIYAGYSAAYDAASDMGCGINDAAKKGCGFGYENWDSANGMGSLKILGSIAEYRSQTTGRLSSPPTGYQRRLIYDNRFLQDLTPPGYPLATSINVFPSIRSYRTYRVSQNE